MKATAFAAGFLGGLLQPLITRVGLFAAKVIAGVAGVVFVVALRWWMQQHELVQALIVLGLVGLAVWFWHKGGEDERPRRAVAVDDRPQRRPMPEGLRRRVIARDHGICQICGFRVREGEEHIDHIHPVHAGGTDDIDNLQTAHAECNLRKGGMVGWVSPWKRVQ